MLQTKAQEKNLKNCALICAVPFALHAYDHATQSLFNAALNRLESESTLHNVVQTTRDIHHWIAINPLTQCFVTQQLQKYIKINS